MSASSLAPSHATSRAPRVQRGARSSGLVIALTVLLAWLPLPFGSHRAWAESLYAVLVGLLLLGFVIHLGRRGTAGSVPLRRLGIEFSLLLLLTGWIVLQTLSILPSAWQHPLWAEAALALKAPIAGAISVDPALTSIALANLLAHVGVFWLCLQAARERENAKRLLYAVILIATFYAAYGLAMELSGARLILWFEKWAYAGDVTATFVNRNSFATYAGLGLLAANAGLSRLLTDTDPHTASARDRWVRLTSRFGVEGSLLLGSVAVLTTALLLTHSRAGLVSTMIGIGAFWVLYLLNRQRRSGRHVAGAAALLLALFAGIEFSGGVTLKRLHDSDFGMTDGRYPVYALMEQAIGDAPYLGFGYGTFERVFPLYRDPTIHARFDLGHNDWLESAMDLGLPGAALLVGLIGLPALRCARGALIRRRDSVYPALGFASSVLVASHALFDFSLQIPAVAAAFAALLGLGVGQSWSSRRD